MFWSGVVKWYSKYYSGLAAALMIYFLRSLILYYSTITISLLSLRCSCAECVVLIGCLRQAAGQLLNVGEFMKVKYFGYC